MEIFVFSYNRGRYLRNCLDSLLRHAPQLPVTVIDDASADPDVSAALAAHGDRVQVIRSTDQIPGSHLGGLYPNMNHALRVATHEQALFIQDDMQLIRDLTDSDLDHAARFFAAYPRAIELHNAFLKRVQGGRRRNDIVLDVDVPVYFRKPDARGSVYFSAVGIFHVERLREMNYTFSGFESDNDARLAERTEPMGITPFPSMMWLPFAETSKFRRKGWLQRYAEWKTGVGFYPYRPMSESTIAEFFARDLQDLPIAEEWLEPVGMSERDVWNFADAAKFVRITKKILKFRKRMLRRAARRGKT